LISLVQAAFRCFLSPWEYHNTIHGANPKAPTGDASA